MKYTDKYLICVEPTCGQEFLFPATEQDFFARLKEQNPEVQDPKRCHECRKNRKNKKTVSVQVNPVTPRPSQPDPIRSFQPEPIKSPPPVKTQHLSSQIFRRVQTVNAPQKISPEEIIAALNAEISMLKEEIEELNAQLGYTYSAKVR